MTTYLDSSVLLTAWRLDRPESRTALQLIDEAGREFHSSQLVRLELLPKAIYFKQDAEVAFYQKYFSLVKGEESVSESLYEEAYEIAKKHGIAAIDALHVAAAVRRGVREFVTTERAGKPIFRVAEIKVISLASIQF